MRFEYRIEQLGTDGRWFILGSEHTSAAASAEPYLSTITAALKQAREA